MKRLNQATVASREEVCKRLRDERAALETALEIFNSAANEAWTLFEDAVAAYNDTITHVFEAVTDAETKYNEAIHDANCWREQVATDIQSYIDNRSEKWLESERGQAYAEWLSEYERAEIEQIDLSAPDPIEVEQPNSIELDDDDPVDALEQLTEELEG